MGCCRLARAAVGGVNGLERLYSRPYRLRAGGAWSSTSKVLLLLALLLLLLALLVLLLPPALTWSPALEDEEDEADDAERLAAVCTARALISSGEI